MQKTNLIPTRIDKFSHNEMLLAWSTGEEFVVPFPELRFLCPCAACVDEHTGQRTIQRSSIAADVRPTQVQMVGRYAIQMNWSDGHSTGMYHYEWLHEICEKTGRRMN